MFDIRVTPDGDAFDWRIVLRVGQTEWTVARGGNCPTQAAARGEAEFELLFALGTLFR